MTEAKHTPGEWEFNDFHEIVAVNGCVLAQVSRPDRRIRGKERREELAYCKANGLLMSAAPKLLEALKMAQQHIDDLVALYAAEQCDPERVKQAGERIHSVGMLYASAVVTTAASEAIAKATGEQA